MQHDACGVGFVAHTAGRVGRDVVSLGLNALRRLSHRGAPPELGAVDGCGVMTAIPWGLIDASPEPLAGRTRALGMIFVDPSQRAAMTTVVERELRAAGACAIVWRDVPVDPAAVLPNQRSTTPDVVQVIAAFNRPAARTRVALYKARLSIEAAARRDGLRLCLVSLSTRTVVYKGLLTPQALDRFYPDLRDERFTSAFILFHQRFSTNTTADWAMAQPFRALAHNGEINTIAGNRSWMRARMADATSLPGFEHEPISLDGSDSRALDDAIELLVHRGYSLAHAVTRLVPPAWERDGDLSADVRAFHEFQSLISEPWDGPSALAFADGRFVGAALDRNGFRPARVVSTADGLIAVASEAGVLPADEHTIADRDRLGPGDMILVDLARGTVQRTREIRRRLASQRPYRALVERVVSRLDLGPRAVHGGDGLQVVPHDTISRVRRQAVHGCSREEIDLLLKPMMADGHEAVGSMGDDAPPAVLSSRPRLFTDFFRQRFAQVTNPPVDPYRESLAMSLTTLLGAQGEYLDETAPRPPRLVLPSPILTEAQLAAFLGRPEGRPLQLTEESRPNDPPAIVIDTTFDVSGAEAAFEQRLFAAVDEACRAVERGASILVLTDREVDAARAPLPALLATAAVHHGLIARGLRLRASLVVDTGDARDAHQVAALCAYGASAVCPSLGYATVSELAGSDRRDRGDAVDRYRAALERGLLTIMSKMGVCTFSGYCGSQLFEILGLDGALVGRCFPGTPSPIGGATLADVAATTVDRHRRAFAPAPAPADYPGLHTYRRDGEYHATNPLVVRSLQRATSETVAASETVVSYATFTSHVYNRPPTAIRDLLEFAPRTPIAIDDVESADRICRRFFASAMSVGALSPEAHRAVAVAMNRLGARSNSGEGGEEPDRFVRPAAPSDWDGSRTKQVASARFGVTPAYLRSADELQIKIAQGSKPGEGGQLPGVKVVSHIARLRHAQPGTPLISPPVHHDIYSIEDLAQLVFDLRAFHPAARINVKLVASAGVGIIAAGVAKAGADAIQISGHDGGTGASPRGSIKHAGMPWEIGLSAAHRALVGAGLRDRVVLQTDGGLKTGRDIALAAALGADEYGFGTAALVALGCVMARQCHANTCPVGIATQRPDLRASFAGSPEMLVGYLKLVAGEVREILAALGLARVGDLVGRADLLRRRDRINASVSLDGLLAAQPPAPSPARAPSPEPPVSSPDRAPSPPAPAPSPQPRAPGLLSLEMLTRKRQFLVSGPIANTDRAFGADVAGAIAARFGDAGLPDGSVHFAMTGSAGQSFGAFALPGMRLVVVGDANDGVGKGMHGGDIVIAPAARERGRARQVLVGNAALYGATGGRLFVAGVAGERFAVRNSGALAVVEGVGDHACEYMTGGTLVILGDIGRNFGAGMTGGVAYVRDEGGRLARRLDQAGLSAEPLTPLDHSALRDLLDAHIRYTASRVARSILRHDPLLTRFLRVAARTPAAEVPVEKAVNE